MYVLNMTTSDNKCQLLPIFIRKATFFYKKSVFSALKRSFLGAKKASAMGGGIYK